MSDGADLNARRSPHQPRTQPLISRRGQTPEKLGVLRNPIKSRLPHLLRWPAARPRSRSRSLRARHGQRGDMLVQVHPQKHEGDCGLSCLAMLVAKHPDEVLLAAGQVQPKVLKRGSTSPSHPHRGDPRHDRAQARLPSAARRHRPGEGEGPGATTTRMWLCSKRWARALECHRAS